METRLVNIPEKSLLFPAWKTIGFLVHVHFEGWFPDFIVSYIFRIFSFQIFSNLVGLKVKNLSPRSSSNCTKSSPEIVKQ